jgi:hypothetical protein
VLEKGGYGREQLLGLVRAALAESKVSTPEAAEDP